MTTFTDSEIRKWHKCFRKDCPSGQLTTDEFQQIYSQFFPYGDSSAFAQHIFRRFDADHNQRISFREFLTGLSITSKGNIEEKLNWALSRFMKWSVRQQSRRKMNQHRRSELIK